MKTVSNKIENNNLLVKIEGEVDVYTSIDLKKELSKYIEDGERSIIIDLDQVNYMDSSGLGVLVAVLKELKKVGGDLKLINLPLSVKKIFDLTRLTKFFSIYKNLEEASK
ncbi:MAG: STAS domain-containing protein [Fusobacteriaceae bacterium]|jgi:anti-sigma B factor antagonist|nr:STAS domain-containing protein [Fusobacteriaceae bacterium]